MESNCFCVSGKYSWFTGSLVGPKVDAICRPLVDVVNYPQNEDLDRLPSDKDGLIASLRNGSVFLKPLEAVPNDNDKNEGEGYMERVCIMFREA